MSAPLIISALEVQQMLTDAGILSLDTWIADRFYTPLDPGWIMTGLFDGWRGYLFAMGITEPEPEDGDCDDYALGLMAYARALHRRTPARPRGAQAGIGEIWYNVDGIGGRHAICPVITVSAGQPVIGFIEPQPPRFGFVSLTPPELASATYTRL